MATENDPKLAPKGLYKDPESGAEIGCLDEAQAAAAVRAGFKLVEDGDVYKTQEAMDKDKNPPEHDVHEGGATYTPSVKKGGK